MMIHHGTIITVVTNHNLPIIDHNYYERRPSSENDGSTWSIISDNFSTLSRHFAQLLSRLLNRTKSLFRIVQ